MKEVIKLDTVDQYNQFFGLETLHPLVSVVDLSEATKFPTHFTMNYGIYALFFEKVNAGTSAMAGRFMITRKGRSPALLRQVEKNGDAAGSEAERPRSLFHPDLIKGTLWDRHQAVFILFVRLGRSPAPIRGRKGIFMDCLEKIEMELQQPDRQAQQTSDFAEHRTTAGLLHALLRKAVHHPFGKQQERAGEIRSLARRLFPQRQTANGRAAFRKILRRQSIPVTQLFRRPDKERNRKKRAGIHSDQNDRFSQRDDCRDGKDGQPDCL